MRISEGLGPLYLRGSFFSLDRAKPFFLDGELPWQ